MSPSKGKPVVGSNWEIPEAAEPVRADPWRSPGNDAPLRAGASPFSCKHCGAGLSLNSAFVLGGDLYCAAHQPPGAASSRDVPPDNDSADALPTATTFLGAILDWLLSCF